MANELLCVHFGVRNVNNAIIINNKVTVLDSKRNRDKMR